MRRNILLLAAAVICFLSAAIWCLHGVSSFQHSMEMTTRLNLSNIDYLAPKIEEKDQQVMHDALIVAGSLVAGLTILAKRSENP